MAKQSTAGAVAKFGLGVGAGFGIYWLVTHFGFGGFGRDGGGGGGGGRASGSGDGGDDRGEPAQPPVPALLKDERPLLLWVESSSPSSKLPDPTARARGDVTFRVVDLGPAEIDGDQLRTRISEAVSRAKGKPPLHLDEAIARVKAGGRDDVRLMTSGGTVKRNWDDAKDALMAAGIKHWLLWEEIASDRKPGSAPKGPHWDLFGLGAPDFNPDKNGHYHVEWKGLSFWNIAKTPDKPVAHVSGARGEYARPRGNAAAARGRGHYGGDR